METKDFNYLESTTNNSLFVILDIETTGFSPKRGDKILEIAIITFDLQGNIIDKYETLINPNREVNASHIHHITAKMVKSAPLIDEVMDDIIFHLNNKTIVGHNIDFDLRFINYEMSKYLKRTINLNGLCTIKLSKYIIPDIPARRLESFCEYFNIEETHAHSAMGDCLATLELFNIFKSLLLEKMNFNEFSEYVTNPVFIKKDVKPTGKCLKRSDAIKIEKQEVSRLYNMIKRLPSNPSDSIPVQRYLNILDEILSDRIISDKEYEKLYEFITEYKISQKQVIEIHNEYIRKLTRVYLLDDILSESEMKDLINISGLLLIKKETLYKIIEFEKAKIARQKILSIAINKTHYIGKSICFTGQLNAKIDGKLVERSIAQQYAIEHGLIIKSGVSKKLDYLVTSDPYSLSGKARKARNFGVKIIAEPVFWNMIGVSVE